MDMAIICKENHIKIDYIFHFYKQIQCEKIKDSPIANDAPKEHNVRRRQPIKQ